MANFPPRAPCPDQMRFQRAGFVLTLTQAAAVQAYLAAQNGTSGFPPSVTLSPIIYFMHGHLIVCVDSIIWPSAIFNWPRPFNCLCCFDDFIPLYHFLLCL